MQTTILGMSQSTSTQRGKRTRKGKQPIQDDQPQPQFVFRPSWVHAMLGNCNWVIRDLLQLSFCQKLLLHIYSENLCMTYPFVNADFCPSMPQWPFCYAGCRLSRKNFLFFLVFTQCDPQIFGANMCKHLFFISIFLLTQYLHIIPLILLSAACIIEKSFGADMHRELGP